MADFKGPTVRRRIIASELRRLRDERGLRQQEAAAAVGIEQSALSRYEQAKSSMTVHLAESLLRYYGVQGEDLGALLRLVQESRRRGWIADVKGKVWKPLEELVALERDAESIQEMAIQVVPGLMQTERYATAILTAGRLGPTAEQHVQSRLARAGILHGEDPASYWVILREPALRCAVGGKATMRAQLTHICELAALPNITLQVLPDHVGEHMAMATPFSILKFPTAPDYGIVYLDYLTGALYQDTAQEVEKYEYAFRHLIKAALPERSSVDFVASISKDLYA